MEDVMRMSAAPLKVMAKRLLPPIVVDWIQQARQTICCVAPEWEYLPDGWATKDDKEKGWADPTIPKTQKAKWGEFLRATQGTGPLGIAHEAPSLGNDDYYAHHIMMAYAYVFTLAARKKDRISILDWGGGIGHYLIFSRSLVPDLDIEYCCKDLPLLCEVGREVLPEAQFVDRETEVASRRYDLVLASGSLPYVEDWKSVARLLASIANPYLYVTRLPFVRQGKSFVVRQRVHAYGYDTEIKSWFLNRGEFLEYMNSLGQDLVREFVFDKHPMVTNAQEQANIQGFLFKRKGARG
jgi:putative methyltransferase (TIGR04325 family)